MYNFEQVSLEGLTTQTFTQNIEDIVRRNSMNHIDAVTFFCEQNNFDVEDILPFLGATLKGKITVDARDLHLVPRTSQLPI